MGWDGIETTEFIVSSVIIQSQRRYAPGLAREKEIVVIVVGDKTLE